MVKLSRLDGFLDISRRERHFFSCFSPLIKLINGFSSSNSVSVVMLICKQILTYNCSKYWCADNKTGFKNNHVMDKAKSRASTRQHIFFRVSHYGGNKKTLHTYLRTVTCRIYVLILSLFQFFQQLLSFVPSVRLFLSFVPFV